MWQVESSFERGGGKGQIARLHAYDIAPSLSDRMCQYAV
jgi:hypothetical protein